MTEIFMKWVWIKLGYDVDFDFKYFDDNQLQCLIGCMFSINREYPHIDINMNSNFCRWELQIISLDSLFVTEKVYYFKDYRNKEIEALIKCLNCVMENE